MRRSWSYLGRWALITGASSGIGEAFAKALASRGMNLCLAARRVDRLRALADALHKSHGVECEVIGVDLASPEGPQSLWERASAGGGREIHLSVHSAGFGLQGAFDSLPLERQLALVDLNVRSLLELCGLVLPPMRERGAGAVINVASALAFEPVPLLATYAASKAFVVSLSESLWEEYGRDGVHVMALCPGGVATEFQAVAGSKLPGLGVLPTMDVVERCLQGLEQGRPLVVPGLANRFAAFGPRFLPRSWLPRISRYVVETLK